MHQAKTTDRHQQSCVTNALRHFFQGRLQGVSSGKNPMVSPSNRCQLASKGCMKAIVLLAGLGLFLLVGTVGCEDEHEHHGGYRGGSYEGPYHDSGYGAYPGYYHHDRD